MLQHDECQFCLQSWHTNSQSFPSEELPQGHKLLMVLRFFNWLFGVTSRDDERVSMLIDASLKDTFPFVVAELFAREVVLLGISPTEFARDLSWRGEGVGLSWTALVLVTGVFLMMGCRGLNTMCVR